MNSFEVELRTLIDVWRERGTPLKELIEILEDEADSLQDLLDAGEA